MKFKEVNCSVYESVGTVEHTLVLNKPLSASVIFEVITVSQTTQSELHNTYVAVIVCTKYIVQKL